MNLKSSIGIYSMCVSYLEGERKGMEENTSSLLCCLNSSTVAAVPLFQTVLPALSLFIYPAKISMPLLTPGLCPGKWHL